MVAAHEGGADRGRARGESLGGVHSESGAAGHGPTWWVRWVRRTPLTYERARSPARQWVGRPVSSYRERPVLGPPLAPISLPRRYGRVPLDAVSPSTVPPSGTGVGHWPFPGPIFRPEPLPQCTTGHNPVPGTRRLRAPGAHHQHSGAWDTDTGVVSATGYSPIAPMTISAARTSIAPRVSPIGTEKGCPGARLARRHLGSGPI